MRSSSIKPFLSLSLVAFAAVCLGGCDATSEDTASSAESDLTSACGKRYKRLAEYSAMPTAAKRPGDNTDHAVPKDVSIPTCGLPGVYVRPGSPVERDLDGDGKADLLLTTRVDDRRSAMVLFHGTAGTASGFDAGECVISYEGTDNSDRASAFGDLLIGDFDGDGALDVAANDGHGETRIISDIAGARRELAGSRYQSNKGTVQVMVGRFDADNADDLLFVTDGAYHVLYGGPPVDGPLGVTPFRNPQRKRTEYVNWDGPAMKAENKARAPFIALPAGELHMEREAIVGDFDGNGVDEVIFYDPAVTRENRSNVSTDAPTLCAAEGAEPQLRGAVLMFSPGANVVGVGDFDGDHRDEILVRTETVPECGPSKGGMRECPAPVTTYVTYGF